jgi:acyl-CoA reductase-like NAD-dependent aldehyde dehydrogenase
MSTHSANREQPVAPFIGGGYVPSRSDACFDAINPSSGRPFLKIPVGCEADVDDAVTSARRAFEGGGWSDAPPSFRKKVLHSWADLIAAESAQLDELDAAEMGKPVGLAFGNAVDAAELMRFYAESVDKITGDVYSSDRNSLVLQRRVPRGVVGAIVPWNFPTSNAVFKVAPALAAGNCAVLKPSELASRSALRLAELALQAGVPPGVLNVVPGLGGTVGRALGKHMDVDMIAFTGSTEVGKLLLQYAGQSNMKVVMAECGGKSPQIVFADGVDLDEASESIADFLLINQGQICSVGSRLLVHRSIEASVVQRVVTRVKQIVMGNALDPKTTFGPLVSERQCAKVMHYIEGAQIEGAELVAGGRQVMKSAGGYFVEPTVFRNVSPKARIAREEIFGPVLSVMPFDDEAEAIRIANNTIYGLVAYVWTGNLSTGMRMAKGIRSAVLINAVAPKGEGAGYAVSREPVSQSGVGTESGLAGMETYLRRQPIWFNHA